MASIASKADGSIDKVMGFVVVLAILGGTIGLVFTNLDTVVTAFENFTSSNATLQLLVPIFGLVLGIGVILGIVKLVKRLTS